MGWRHSILRRSIAAKARGGLVMEIGMGAVGPFPQRTTTGNSPASTTLLVT